MADRRCIFAWTDPYESTYPAYINVSRVGDGPIRVFVRGHHIKAGRNDNPNSFTIPGREVEIELQDDQRALLMLALQNENLRDCMKAEVSNERRPQASNA